MVFAPRMLVIVIALEPERITVAVTLLRLCLIRRLRRFDR